MLIDYEPVAGVLGKHYKEDELWSKEEDGVFITHLNGYQLHFPSFKNAKFSEEKDVLSINYRQCYGVCDNVEQVKKHYPELVHSDRKFVVCMTPIVHAEETEQSWRWHKWGVYIGDHTPKCEYLFDEVGIEKVFVFKILEQ